MRKYSHMSQDQIILECRTIVALSDKADQLLDDLQIGRGDDHAASNAVWAVTDAICNFMTALLKA